MRSGARLRTPHLFAAIFAVCWILALMEPMITYWTQTAQSRRLGVASPTNLTLPSFRITLGIPIWTEKGGIGLDFRVYDHLVRHTRTCFEAYEYRANPFMKSNLMAPPLSYYFFGWTRLLPENGAAFVWTLFNLFGIFLITLIWMTRAGCSAGPPGAASGPSLRLLISGLFLFTYPVLFAFERGQTDIVVLILVSAGIFAYDKRRFFVSGLLISVAAFFKVYPVLLAAAIGLAGLALVTSRGAAPEQRDLQRRRGLGLLGGLAAGAWVSVAFCWPETLYYIRTVLGELERGAEDLWMTHSMSIVYGWRGVAVAGLLWAAGVACLVRLTLGRSEESRQAEASYLRRFSLAYLTAVMVYFASVSFDYNLILTIPLLAVLLCGEPRRGRRLMLAGFGLFFTGFALPRNTYPVLQYFDIPGTFYMWLQVSGLALLGTVLVRNVFGRALEAREDSAA
ncbi:MAG: DUF2029 domain-containing protein [Candidatus Omnitrophica bacterium]|nr:DUF2029 domain-containing protein [Candidatus Omnitrophota bacterium]